MGREGGLTLLGTDGILALGVKVNEIASCVERCPHELLL